MRKRWLCISGETYGGVHQDTHLIYAASGPSPQCSPQSSDPPFSPVSGKKEKSFLSLSLSSRRGGTIAQCGESNYFRPRIRSRERKGKRWTPKRGLQSRWRENRVTRFSSLATRQFYTSSPSVPLCDVYEFYGGYITRLLRGFYPFRYAFAVVRFECS